MTLHITKVLWVERYFGYGNVGIACKLDEMAINLVDRMIELRSSGPIKEACQICEDVGMVDAYIGSDDNCP